MPAGDNSFPKDRRIRSRPDYLRLQGQGRRIVGRRFVFLWQANQNGQARLGITVTRRVAGAVGRNRVKRLVKEAFRTMRPVPPAVDLVVIAKAGPRQPTLEEVRRELAWALGKMAREISGA